MPREDPVLQVYLLDGAPEALGDLLAGEAGIARTPLGLEIPLGDRAPEEVLALLLRHGITARATRIVSRPRSG